MLALPEVSVVIPTRDRWHLLRQALDSALGQRDVSAEVVVVDDGSRDETPARLAALRDDRVRVYRNEPSRGVAAARNTGIAHARAPWVAFLDDDDLWSPDKLKRQLSAAAAGAAEFAYGAVVFVDARLEVIASFPPPRPDHLLANLLPVNAFPAGASNVLVRTDVLRRVGGFDESLMQVEDWDLWIRLAQICRPATCPEPLVAYRVHEANRVVRQEAGVIEEIERLALKHSAAGEREGAQIDRVSYTRWIAGLQRRQGRRFAAATTYLRGAIRYRKPGNVPRAVGALLGERAMEFGRAFVAGPNRGESRPDVGDVSWLEPYRGR